MIRFNYGQNLLHTKTEAYCLDALREYLLRTAADLCISHKIRTILRAGASVVDTVCVIDGTPFKKREITLSGKYINTYDWDTIFFTASRKGLIQNFINDYHRNRTGSAEAIAI